MNDNVRDLTHKEIQDILQKNVKITHDLAEIVLAQQSLLDVLWRSREQLDKKQN